MNIKYKLRPITHGSEPGEVLGAVICACISLVTALIVRTVSGSPHKVISFCGMSGIIPPVWVMVVCWVIWYIALGAAFGAVLGCTHGDEVSKYKGGMLFILMMSLGYVWYPLFFCAMAFLASLLVCEAVLVLSVMCALCFLRVKKAAALVMLGFSAWMAYMVILNVIILLD